MRIRFLAGTEEQAAAFDPPVPASRLVPEWYRRQGGYVNDDRAVDPGTGRYLSTVKHCMPVVDAMSTGYVLTMPCDVHVTRNVPGEVHTSWPLAGYTAIESHDMAQASEFAIDTAVWNPALIKLMSPWTIATEPGYSTLFVPPLWHDEHRFQALPGVVDTDRYPQPVNFPFMVRQDFIGVIPNGTPFVQLIPFRRETWTHEVGVNPAANHHAWLRATRDTIHRYKRHFRAVKRWG